MLLLDFTDLLACVELFVWDGIARGENPSHLVLRLLCISLRVARVLTYLSRLRAI